LEQARPYDLALPGTAFFAKFGGLYPVYVRGVSYLAAGSGQEAAVEFQKVFDHHGIVLGDPIGSLARLQLGRAYIASGDLTQALRRTFANWMQKTSATVKDVQDAMRHGSPDRTLKAYMREIPAGVTAAVEELALVITGVLASAAKKHACRMYRSADAVAAFNCLRLNLQVS